MKIQPLPRDTHCELKPRHPPRLQHERPSRRNVAARRLTRSNYSLAVRDKVCPQKPFAIGLRLSNRAAMELSERETLLQFQRWLAQNNCYVFTMNGFPYGQFHARA